MSVFVSIAAYRDKELPATLDSVVNNSTLPLHISIVEQCTNRERIDVSKWESNRVRITLHWMHPNDAKGAGYARKLALQAYDGEDYFFQIDSHTQLIEAWDLELISTLKQAQKIDGQPKIVLSHYPAGYVVEDKIYKLHNDKRYVERPQKQKPFVDRQGQIAARRIEKEHSGPELATTVLAGYVFSLGEFAHLGYDENISFWGEEFMIGITAWLHGWRIYAPDKMYMWHHYGRQGRVRVWKDLPQWAVMEYESMEHQAAVFRELRKTSNWLLLHQDHRDTIEEFLANRDEVNSQSYTEVEFYDAGDMIEEISRSIINGKPSIIEHTE